MREEFFDISTISTNSEIKNNGDSLTVNTALSSVRCPTTESFHKICHGVPSNIAYNFNAITTSDLKQVYFNSGVLWSFAKSKSVDDSMQQSPIYFYGNSINELGIISDIQLELGSVKTSYEPYCGETIAVALGQTVYGGTLDVGTGELTVNSKYITIENPEDVNVLSYSQTSDLTIASIYPVMQEGVVGKNAICSHFFYSQPTYPSLGYSNTAPRVFMYFSVQDYPTIDSVKEFFRQQAQNGSPVQVVYKLASATTIQLSPQQILALSGTNTLYADAGDITVTGVSDPGAAIATLQDRLTALENNTLN